MKIKSIELKNYRNIENEKINFTEGVNVLFGKNAQGKTNVIEAVYSFSRGKSFRGANDRRLVKLGEEYYFAEIEYEDKKRSVKMSYMFKNGEKIKKKNGVEEKRICDMLGSFRAVLFCPEHLQLVKGSPSERRDFLNIAISQTDSDYIKLYSDFAKVLENRNSILKEMQREKRYKDVSLEVFSEQLAEYCTRICLKRKRYVKELEIFVKKIMSDISENKENISLVYESDVWEDEPELMLSHYREIFLLNTEKEVNAGVTLFGIHRDDIDIQINGVSSRSFASQGQQRSIALAFKIAEGEICKKYTGEYPVFLFDDVLSELNEKRKKYILDGTENKQIIITSCDREIFESREVNIIEVEGGHYVSSYR